MLKLCIDNTSTLHEFHLYEPYLYEVMKNQNCVFLNDFSRNNSDIEKFDITICSAENILLERRELDYEVTVVTDLLNENENLIKKLYEIEKHITSRFTNSSVQKTKNITIILLDYTGNSFVNFKESLYVLDGQSDLYFTKEDLYRAENVLKTTKNREEFIKCLLDIRDKKTVNRENEWYYYIFSKMFEHFYDNNIIELNENGTFDLIDIFKRLMSYFVKTEIIDSTFILRCDMSIQRNVLSAQKKMFIDMNKIIALITFDMEQLLSKSKSILYKGIYDVHIGLDEEKVQNMIRQYSENLKAQLDIITKNKPNRIDVQNRVVPNVSLRKIYLEPVKIKKERLTFFRSSKNYQYLDRIEKYLTNEMNNHIKKAKNNNIKNICDLRTLRYTDDSNVPKNKLSLIEIKDRIDERTNLFRRKNAEVFKDRADYYEILDDYLKKQKIEKDKIIEVIKRKVKLNEFFIITFLLYILTAFFVLTSNLDIVEKYQDTKELLITIGAIAFTFITSTVIVSLFENRKIKKLIDKYIEFVNGYNDKLQISSNYELSKLLNTYELIILNSDIAYYKEVYNKLLTEVSKYEFHISQLGKHLEIARRLCARADIDFDNIIIADDSIYDEKNVDLDINKDVYQNPCYSIMRFLFKTKDYCIMLNCGEVVDKVEIETYIKSINFTEDEVYKF